MTQNDYFQNSLILGGCHGNQAIQLSSPYLLRVQHRTSILKVQVVSFEKKWSYTVLYLGSDFDPPLHAYPVSTLMKYTNLW